MARGKMKDGWCCVKCDLPMESVLLPRYEFEIVLFRFCQDNYFERQEPFVCVPSELVDQIKIKQGQKVRIIPIAREGFRVKVGR